MPARRTVPTRRRRAAGALTALLAAPALIGLSGSAAAPPAPTTTPSATAAAAALPAVQARPADSLVDSFGVAIHTPYLDTPYADTARVTQALTDLGVRHVRDNLNLSVPQSFAAMRQIASAGIRFDLIMGRPGSWQTPQKLVEAIAAELPTGVVESLEGANEYNLDEHAVDWVLELRTHQQQLWEAANANPVTADLPVLAPALGMRTGFDQIADLGQYADYGNAHLYPGGRPPSWGIDELTQLEAIVVPGKPVMYTESGYHNATNTTSGHRPTPEPVVGSYAPRLLLEHYLRGTARVYNYELLDERADPGLTDHEAAFGLLRHDFSPKPAYLALKNLLGLVADPGPAFSPGRLAYTVDGATSDLRQVLVQKRSGEFVLLLWRDQSLYNPSTGEQRTVPPRAMTVRLDERARVAVHVPSAGSAPVASGAGTSVPLSMAGEVVALRIRPPAEPGSPARLKGKAKDRAAVLRWKRPATDGGSPVTAYVIRGLPGPRKVVVVPADRLRFTVLRLKNGKRYTFKVRAVNAVGRSLPAKVKVTPRPPRR
ncbi:fibronectin type III domain-containing protein [Nocardioides sp.]|uniref:fibronectin type III domain-containing protein n=1 Tax=Nocardioides sp. TaxID=35761 RepID=UPI001A21E785|nr:fibronectin type III domain-containing protein [Nocardioides sp.]MBJ7357704.1 fibronectin type III domain-containing protein [Nocardioides sp.]